MTKKEAIGWLIFGMCIWWWPIWYIINAHAAMEHCPLNLGWGVCWVMMTFYSLTALVCLAAIGFMIGAIGIIMPLSAIYVLFGGKLK